MKRLALLLLCAACTIGASDLPHRRVHFRTSSWWLAGGISPSVVVAAWKPKDAATLGASYADVTGNGHTASVGSAPTLTAMGWRFPNGGNKYLLTGVTPAVGYTVIIRYYGLGVGRCMFGSFNSNARLFLAPYGDGANTYFCYGTDASVMALNSGTAGVMCVSAGKYYLNGNLVKTTGASWSGTGVQFAVGCRNNNGTMQEFANGTFVAGAVYSGALTDAQVSALTVAINAL